MDDETNAFYRETKEIVRKGFLYLVKHELQDLTMRSNYTVFIAQPSEQNEKARIEITQHAFKVVMKSNNENVMWLFIAVPVFRCRKLKYKFGVT